MWELGAYRPFNPAPLASAPADDTKFDGFKINRAGRDVELMLRPCVPRGASRELGVFFDEAMAVLYLEETLALDPHNRLARGPNGWAFPIYVCESSSWFAGDGGLEVNREGLTHWAIVTLNDTLHVLSSDRIGLQWQGKNVEGFWSDGAPLN